MNTLSTILKVARMMEQTGGEHLPFHLDHLQPDTPPILPRPYAPISSIRTSNKKRRVLKFIEVGSGELKLVVQQAFCSARSPSGQFYFRILQDGDRFAGRQPVHFRQKFSLTKFPK